MKKENYLKWDEYFMGIALLSAERSKDNRWMPAPSNNPVRLCTSSESNKSTGEKDCRRRGNQLARRR